MKSKTTPTATSGSHALLEKLHSCVFLISVIFGLKGCGFGFLRVSSHKKKSKKNWRVARINLMASKLQGQLLDAWTFTITGIEKNLLTRNQMTKNIHGFLIYFLFSIFTWFIDANLDWNSLNGPDECRSIPPQKNYPTWWTGAHVHSVKYILSFIVCCLSSLESLRPVSKLVVQNEYKSNFVSN